STLIRPTVHQCEAAEMQGDLVMHVSVNGVRLFFDVEGAKFVPDGPVMREKPVLLMLHGGPGFDHSIYRPAYSALADIAQIVYLDDRGNGRSEGASRRQPARGVALVHQAGRREPQLQHV